MRNRAFRRHKANAKMWRRLKEDRNQHYENLTCACYTEPKAMARFKEQPKMQSCYCCSSPVTPPGPRGSAVQFRSVEQHKMQNKPSGPDIQVNMDEVVICGQQVPRPSYISRSCWMAYWERLAPWIDQPRMKRS